ncbi:MAG: flagellar protein [Selenomonadaceae bacterium]|nr:flagellar protein [Selenomonadaceae bacterium]
MAKLNLKNCVSCHKVFLSVIGESICPECRVLEQTMEEDVKEYVRDHPGITIRQLIDETGAPDKLIWRMVRQGQFDNASGLEVQYPCGKCGKLIKNGAYCPECAVKLKMEAKKFADAMKMRAHAAADKAPTIKGGAQKTYSETMYNEIEDSHN